MTTTKSLLRIDTSIRTSGSATRALTDKFLTDLTAANPGLKVVTRDLKAGLPLIDEAWTGANYTAPDARTEDQKQILAQSDSLIEEMKAADAIVIGLPVYNFSIPAGLKTWIDLVARVGVTFRYTEAGPEGLLKGKKVYLLVASGGTPVGSGYDFASTYMKHVLGFLGIDDVTVIAADQMAVDAEAALAAAHSRIDDEVATFDAVRAAA